MTDEEEFKQYQLRSSFFPKAVAKHVRRDLYEAELSFYGVHYIVGHATTREQALAAAQVQCDLLRDLMLGATKSFLKQFKVAKP